MPTWYHCCNHGWGVCSWKTSFSYFVQSPSKPILTSPKGPNKRKWGTSRGVAASDTPVPKRTRSVPSRQAVPTVTPPTNPPPRKKKMMPATSRQESPKDRLWSASKNRWIGCNLLYQCSQQQGSTLYPPVYFTYLCTTFLTFKFNCLIHSASPFVWCMYVLVELFWCSVLVRTQRLSSLGGLCYYIVSSWVHCICFCCVLCKALLSNICLWIWKPNEDKLSVIQYLWECQVEIVIDGGWNSVPTLRFWLSCMRLLEQSQKNRKDLKFGGRILMDCACYEINFDPMAQVAK